jgi:hypothetical protein
MSTFSVPTAAVLPLDVEEPKQTTTRRQGAWQIVNGPVCSIKQIMHDEPERELQEANEQFKQDTLFRRQLFALESEIEQLHAVWSQAVQWLEEQAVVLDEIVEENRWGWDDQGRTCSKWKSPEPARRSVDEAAKQEGAAYQALALRICDWESTTKSETQFTIYGHGRDWIKDGFYESSRCKRCMRDPEDCYCTKPCWQRCASLWNVRCVTDRDRYELEQQERDTRLQELGLLPVTEDKDEDESQSPDVEWSLFWETYSDEFLVRGDAELQQVNKKYVRSDRLKQLID